MVGGSRTAGGWSPGGARGGARVLELTLGQIGAAPPHGRGCSVSPPETLAQLRRAGAAAAPLGSPPRVPGAVGGERGCYAVLKRGASAAHPP